MCCSCRRIGGSSDPCCCDLCVSLTPDCPSSATPDRGASARRTGAELLCGYVPAQTNPLLDASSCGRAKRCGLLADTPSLGWFAHCGSPQCERRPSQDGDGDRAGRSLCRPSVRAGSPAQRLPGKHAGPAGVRFGRFDVSLHFATRDLHRLQPGSSWAICGKQPVPSPFRAIHPCSG